MKALFIAMAFALLDFNAPEVPPDNADMYVVELPYEVKLFVSDCCTPDDISDDFVFDFDY